MYRVEDTDLKRKGRRTRDERGPTVREQKGTVRLHDICKQMAA